MWYFIHVVLESSAYIQPFGRFCNRRITRPKVVCSDDRGNFVMTDKKLNDGIKIWYLKSFQNAMVSNNIEWRFNPPLAPHKVDSTSDIFELFV